MKITSKQKKIGLSVGLIVLGVFLWKRNQKNGVTTPFLDRLG
jgi:hypothetical protein